MCYNFVNSHSIINFHSIIIAPLRQEQHYTLVRETCRFYKHAYDHLFFEPATQVNTIYDRGSYRRTRHAYTHTGCSHYGPVQAG